MTSQLYIGNSSATPSIVIEKPVPMPYSIQCELDSNGKIIPKPILMDFTNITDISASLFAHLYENAVFTENTEADMSSLTKISGRDACSYMFQKSNVTKLNLHNLESVNYNAYDCFSYMCNQCNSLTSVDLHSLKHLDYAGYAFQNCSNLSTLDLSSLITMGGTSNSNAYNTFSYCSSLDSIDLSNLRYISVALYTFANCNNCTTLKLDNIQKTYNSDSVFSGCTNLITVDLSSLKISYDSRNMFSGCTNLESVNLNGLIYPNRMSGYFQNCSKLLSLSFPRFLYRTGETFNFTDMLKGVTGCTVHFPQDWETDMSTWTTFQNGFGGTNTVIKFDLPSITNLVLDDLTEVDDTDVMHISGGIYNDLCKNCKNITSVTISNLTKVNYYSSNMFYGCTNLVSADLSSIKMIGDPSNLTQAGSQSYCLASMFNGCTALTSVDLSNLESLDGSSLFYGCTSLETVTFPSLKRITHMNACKELFRNCTSLRTVNFPALKEHEGNGMTYVFTDMLNGCSNVTVHFPSNLPSNIKDRAKVNVMRGTNTTILFDLPATE